MPINPFRIEKNVVGDVVVFVFRGYFAGDEDDSFRKLVEETLKDGSRRIVFDFTECRLINSPGVVVIMESALRIVDDSKGSLAITGLDSIKTSVFEMAGILPLAELADDLPTALKMVRIG